MSKGKFIVFEGLDGAGTTTQLRLLEENLKKAGVKVFATAEPTDSPIGRLIRSALRKEITVKPETLALLYTADRNEHLYGKGGVIEHLDAGDIVICDRYLYSSIAYQSVNCDTGYIKCLNKDFLQPDLLFYVNTPVEECLKRITNRNQNVELFEKAEYLKAVSNNYNCLMMSLKFVSHNEWDQKNPVTVEIDGTQPIDTISKNILFHVKCSLGLQ